VAADDPRRLDEPAKQTISLLSTNTLLFRLVVDDLPSPVAWVTLRLYTPAGALHQQLHLPFSSDTAMTQVPSPEGMPHPIGVQHAVKGPDGFTLSMSIPVGGTHLQRRPQPGLWLAVATLDQRPEVLATTSFAFTLDP
jgi:hypothetical protein